MLKALRSPIATIVLFALALALVVAGSIQAVNAAPRIQSDDYTAEIELVDIATALTENGKEVADGGELFASLLGDGEQLKIGKTYKDKLAVKNIGTIDEYVRVTVTAYWTDGEGNAIPRTNLDPGLIKPQFVTNKGWTIGDDPRDTTTERTVLYYSKIVGPTNGTSESGSATETTPFISGILIDSSVATIVNDEGFEYEGLQFHVKVTADAVQTHNADDAMMSAWGKTK